MTLTDKKKKNLLNTYGFVQLKTESEDKFLARTSRIIETTKESSKKAEIKTTPHGTLEDATKKVQEVVNKYLGIKEAPLNAYYGKFDGKVGGYTRLCEGGNSIITIPKLSDKKKGLSDKVSQLLGFEDLIMDSINKRNFDFERMPSITKVYYQILCDIPSDEDYVYLHEGIHAVTNNSQTTIKGVANVPFLKAGGISKNLEEIAISEIIAYKTSLDLVTDKILDDALYKTRFLKDSDKKVDAYKALFHQLNSLLVKDAAKESMKMAFQMYYPSIKNFFDLTISPYIGATLIAGESSFWGFIGTYLLANTTDTLFALTNYNRIRSGINKKTKAYDALCQEYGAKGAFFKVLGKHYSEIEKIK